MSKVKQVAKPIQASHILAILLPTFIILSILLWMNLISLTLAENNLSKAETNANQTQQRPTPTKVISAGVKWHGADAWEKATYKGQGIKVGIIDVGFDGLSNLGEELPESINLGFRCYTPQDNVVSGVISIKNLSLHQNSLNHCKGMYDKNHKQTRSDHGTKVAQIITDMAPSATLYIANTTNPGRTQRNVEWMLQQGVDIVNYSVGRGLNAPGDGTSGVSSTTPHIMNSINVAVGTPVPQAHPTPESTPAQSLWVNAGGNEARKTWYGAYHNPDETRETNLFGKYNRQLSFLSTSNKEANHIRLRPGENISVSLRWQDSWGTSPGTTTGASCNLDLYLYKLDSAQHLIHPRAAVSNSIQNGATNDIPFEYFTFAVPTTLPPQGAIYAILINSTSRCPATTHRPNWIQLQVEGSSGYLQYASDKGDFNASGPNYYQIGVPAESNNPGMLSVGTAQAKIGAPNELVVSEASNRGPTIVSLTKPDILGFSCGLVVTGLTAPTPQPTPSTFCGSSASAPHVAGLAALLIQRYSVYRDNPVALANHIRSRAIQYGTPDPNNDWGQGFAFLSPLTFGTARLAQTGTTTTPPSTIYIGPLNSQTTGRNFTGQDFTLRTSVALPPGVIVKVSPELTLNQLCQNGQQTEKIYGTGQTVNIQGCTVSNTANIQINHGNIRIRNYPVTVKRLPTARITPRTTSMTQWTTKTLGLITSNLDQGDQIQVKTSNHLAVQAHCNAPNNRQANVTKGNKFTLYACSRGTGTVTLYTAGGEVELNSHSISVRVATTITPTPTPVPTPGSPNPPTNLRLSKVADNNQKLQLTYTHGGSPNRYQFQLYYLDKLTGNDQFFASENDSRSPETFSDVGRGYQYRARGRNCRTHSDRTTCSAWSAWSNYVTLSNPQITITRLSPTIVNGKSDWFTVQGSDLTYDDPQTITLNSDHASIGFNKSCSSSTSSSFTPIHDQWIGFHLYACDTPGGTITARLRDGNASGTVLDTATKSIKAIHDAELNPEPKIFNINDLTRSTLLGTFSSTTPINITVSKTGDTGKLSLNAHCDSTLKTQGIYYKSAIHGDSVIAIKACRKGRVTIRLYERSLTGDLLKIYSLMVDDDATLTPVPATIANGSAVTFTLGGTFSATQNITIRINRPGDDGRLSFTNTCNAGTSAQVTRVKNGTITLKGCTAGPASIRLFKGRTLLKTYELTVE